MSETRVAFRYAKSLLELATEQGKLEEVHGDMQLFAKTCSENRNLTLALKNPIIKHDKKLAILQGLFSDKVNPLTAKIFEILTRKNREGFLPAIAEQFHNLYNSHKAIKGAVLTTPIAVTPSLVDAFKAEIKKQIGQEVELLTKVDPSIIGGYKLTIGDRQIDESLSSRLNTLKLQFSKNPYIKDF